MDSASLQHDIETVSIHIEDTYRIDDRVSEFFNLLQPTLDISTQVTESLFKHAENPQDIATLSEFVPYPEEIMNLAQRANNRVYLGFFPEISLNYCIIDFTIHFWKFNEQDPQIFTIHEHQKLITCCAYGHSLDFVKVPNAIVISTASSLRLIFYDEKSGIIDNNYVYQTDFFASSLLITKKGEIFTSTDTDDIFVIEYELKNEKIRFKSQRYSYIYYPRKFPRIFRLFPPALQIAYDEYHKILAVLNSRSIIHFYSYMDKKMTHVSTFDPVSIPKNEFITCIQNIPYSQSETTRFIAFISNGDRLFFGKSFGFDGIFPTYKRIAPPIAENDTLIDAYYNLGWTTFIFRESIVITKAENSAHFIDINPPETYVTFALEESTLSFFHQDQMFSTFRSPSFNHEMLWQHVYSPNPTFVLTNKGMRIINYSTIYNKLKKIIDSGFSNQLNQWMSQNSVCSESSATALLLAHLYPSTKPTVFALLHQIAVNSAIHKSPFNVGPPPIQNAFIVRLARIMTTVWFMIIIEERDHKYVLNETFPESYKVVIPQLTSYIEISNEYLKLNKLYQGENAKEMQKEGDTISRYCSVAKYLKETFILINYLYQYKKIIHEAITLMDERSRSRLEYHDFGMKDANPSVFEALRDLVLALYRVEKGPMINDTFSSQLCHDCKSFFTPIDVEIMEKISQIRQAATIFTLKEALKFFSMHISRIVKLSEICAIFRTHKFYEGIIEICLQRANYLDQMNRALIWFNSGRKEEAENGRVAFDSRYKCYQNIFLVIENDHAFQLMTKANDELFHICLYKYMVEIGFGDRIASLNTPFVENFLKDFQPSYLWKFYESRKMFDKAGLALVSIAENDASLNLDERIKSYLMAANFFSACNLSKLERNARHYYQIGQIQKELSIRVNQEDELDWIEDEQDLFSDLSILGYWDLMIRLFAIQPIESNRKQVISQAWQNLMIEQLLMDDLATAKIKVIELIKVIGMKNIELKDLIPILENYRTNKHGNSMWVVSIFEMIENDMKEVYHVYTNMLSDVIVDDFHASLIHTIAYIIHKHNFQINGELAHHIDWFVDNARNYSGYEEVRTFLNV